MYFAVLQISRGCHTSCFVQVRDILQLIIRYLIWLDALLGLLCHIAAWHKCMHAPIHSGPSLGFGGSQVFHFLARLCLKLYTVVSHDWWINCNQLLSAHATSGCLNSGDSLTASTVSFLYQYKEPQLLSASHHVKHPHLRST